MPGSNHPEETPMNAQTEWDGKSPLPADDTPERAAERQRIKDEIALLESAVTGQKEREERLREAVFMALGGASVCWEHMEGTGVFDSDRAKRIGEWLIEAVHEYAASA